METSTVQFKLNLTNLERQSLRRTALDLGISAAALVRIAIGPHIHNYKDLVTSKLRTHRSARA